MRLGLLMGWIKSGINVMQMHVFDCHEYQRVLEH